MTLMNRSNRNQYSELPVELETLDTAIVSITPFNGIIMSIECNLSSWNTATKWETIEHLVNLNFRCTIAMVLIDIIHIFVERFYPYSKVLIG